MYINMPHFKVECGSYSSNYDILIPEDISQQLSSPFHHFQDILSIQRQIHLEKIQREVILQQYCKRYYVDTKLKLFLIKCA